MSSGNIKHSSANDSWMTPTWLIEASREVLGGIDLDPASSEEANLRVGAERFFTREEDGLSNHWHGKVFLNPPGGKDGNKSKAVLFWMKLMEEFWKGDVEAAIFVGFSIEILQTSQGKGLFSVGEHPFCIPSKRIQFDAPEGSVKRFSPSHASLIACVGNVEICTRFSAAFGKYGLVVNKTKYWR
jgi:hypothetical protein